MKVVMLGAGAMGSLIGARLSRTVARVELVDPYREHVEAVRSRGLSIEELDGTLSRHRLVIHADPAAVKDPVDLVIVMVKSPQTGAAMESIAGLCGSRTVVLTLQNGVGHWEAMERFVVRRQILLGTTMQGATFLGPGRIRHGGTGPTHIGCLDPVGEAVEDARRVVDLFNRAGMEAHYGPDIQTRLWQKLLVNVGINAITAIARVTNGWIADHDDARELSARAVEEAHRVAVAAGIALPADSFEAVLAVARATGINRSSMLQDVSAGRTTEIDSINGAVVRLGRRLEVPTPVNWTLTRLIKVIEGRSER